MACARRALAALTLLAGGRTVYSTAGEAPLPAAPGEATPAGAPAAPGPAQPATPPLAAAAEAAPGAPDTPVAPDEAADPAAREEAMSRRIAAWEAARQRLQEAEEAALAATDPEDLAAVQRVVEEFQIAHEEELDWIAREGEILEPEIRRRQTPAPTNLSPEERALLEAIAEQRTAIQTLRHQYVGRIRAATPEERQALMDEFARLEKEARAEMLRLKRLARQLGKPEAAPLEAQ